MYDLINFNLNQDFSRIPEHKIKEKIAENHNVN